MDHLPGSMEKTAVVPGALILMEALSGNPATGASSELELYSYELGSVIGTAIYCREPGVEVMGRLGGHRLRSRAGSRAEWGRAVRVLTDAAVLRVEHGPITQTCGEFHLRYQRVLDGMRGPGRRPGAP